MNHPAILLSRLQSADTGPTTSPFVRAGRRSKLAASVNYRAGFTFRLGTQAKGPTRESTLLSVLKSSRWNRYILMFC
jgi:hypothetical protein